MVDFVLSCDEAASAADASTLFTAFASIFAAYVGMDVVLAGLVLCRRVRCEDRA